MIQAKAVLARGSGVALAASLLLAARTLAQNPAPAPATAAVKLPAAQEIVAGFVKASGGRDAILKQSSRRTTGTFSMPAQGINGNIEILAAKPNLMRITIDVTGLGQIVTGFDGHNAWMINPMTGPMVLEGAQLQQTADDAEFYGTLHDSDQYKQIETVERVDFEGRPCYKVRVVRNAGQEDMEFFDVASGLLAGTQVTRESPMGAVKAINIVSDYRDFDGVKMPTTMVQKISGLEQIVTVTAVEHDKVPAAAFEPPAEIKTLLATAKRP